MPSMETEDGFGSHGQNCGSELNESKVLVIFTGGTIGMQRGPKGAYVPIPNKLEKKLRTVPHLHDKAYVNARFAKDSHEASSLVLPYVPDSARVIYTIYEYVPVMDSSNMTADDFIRIALDIKKFYDQYDGFVILHGTDTLAYSASALSFMLENLGKPVIITGSQIPIFETRSDGQDNFIGAVIIAGNYTIPEVMVFFNNHIYRGNRTSKLSTSELNAFSSPNMLPLGRLGIHINIDWREVIRPSETEEFTVHTKLCRNIGILRIFPGIPIELVRAYLNAPMEGVILQTYGAGNIPSIRNDLMEEFRKASADGVLIVNITQCLQGAVSAEYETGLATVEAGIIPGSDMTPEAALAKLSYVLGKDEWNIETKRNIMMSNLRGELSDGKHRSRGSSWPFINNNINKS